MNSLVLVAFFALFAAASAGVLASAPFVSAYSAAPLVSAYSSPVVGAGLVGEQTVVAGPSGTIATGRTLAAPGIAAYGAYGAPIVSSYAAPALTAYGSPIVSSYAAPGLVARTFL